MMGGITIVLRQSDEQLFCLGFIIRRNHFVKTFFKKEKIAIPSGGRNMYYVTVPIKPTIIINPFYLRKGKITTNCTALDKIQKNTNY